MAYKPRGKPFAKGGDPRQSRATGPRFGAGDRPMATAIELRECLAAAVSREDRVRLLEAMRDRAMEGDTKAASLLLGFMDGRAPESVTVDQHSTGEVRVIVAGMTDAEIQAAAK